MNYNMITPSDARILDAFSKFYSEILKIGLTPQRFDVSIALLSKTYNNLKEFNESELFKKIKKSGHNQISNINFWISNTSSCYIQYENLKTGKSRIQIHNLDGNIQSNLEFNLALIEFTNQLSNSKLNIEENSKWESIEKDIASATSLLKEDLFGLKEKYSEYYHERLNLLAKEYEDRNALLINQHEQKLRALEEREASIERISNTDARRKIRKDLNNELDDRISTFGPSQAITKNHTQLSKMFIGILLMLIVMTVCFGFNISLSMITTSADKFDSVKLALFEFSASLITTMGFFIYYSRWKSNWTNRLLEEEFLLKKYRLDMDRSSWVIESYLELQESHKKELPNGLITAITSNLFQSSNTRIDTALHPIEEVISKVTNNTKLKIKNGKNEVEIDKINS